MTGAWKMSPPAAQASSAHLVRNLRKSWYWFMRDLDSSGTKAAGVSKPPSALADTSSRASGKAQVSAELSTLGS
eukprot:CAMPEP_0117666934 /NCGR_PEP_ID=MMETSP0804-20121206/10662_1 /TAXON_ID=1074897 /ORGANISM="Tetraselmis astigmatica, Strain CCMP880" /LENGTH=73 /DNA_ID=CAMNT_0005474555 /DNA_START=463 /DNA_END=684 /DNA_ORIENTATION=-